MFFSLTGNLSAIVWKKKGVEFLLQFCTGASRHMHKYSTSLQLLKQLCHFLDEAELQKAITSVILGKKQLF